jgi:lipoprotein-releasing system permease protein
MLTLIITNGFERTIHEKMQGINAPIIMRVPGNKVDAAKIRNVIMSELAEKVQATSGSSTGQILIDINNQQTLIFLKGIEPSYEGNVTSVASKLIKTLDKSHNLENLLLDNHILIGHKTAHEFGINVGDTIRLLIPEEGGQRKISLSKKKAIVAGIFNVGLDEYDSGFAFCSIDFFNTIFDKSGVDTIAIKPKETFSWRERLWGGSIQEKVVDILRNRFPSFDVHSWKDLYPALVSSLKLEKYVMFIVIALITLVASMNMISLLFIQIQQKRRDIAILMAMGMSHKSIQLVFLSIGMTITFFGSIVGLGIAGIIGFLLERYPFIELPDVYYVSHLPARVDPELFVIVFACTLLLGFVATFIPARQTKRIKITDVLRME